MTGIEIGSKVECYICLLNEHHHYYGQQSVYAVLVTKGNSVLSVPSSSNPMFQY